jgi:hypothetical protein
MKKIVIFILCFTAYFNVVAQKNLPIVIEIPPLSSDNNFKASLLNFEITDDGNFSTLFYQNVSASVASSAEFISEGGKMVYKDEKKREPIAYSDQVLILFRQLVGKGGNVIDQKSWVFSKRALEPMTDYQLNFPSKYRHFLIEDKTSISLSLQSAGNAVGLTDSEKDALITLIKRDYFPDSYTEHRNSYRRNTLGEDVKEFKESMKSLRETGVLFKGDLPKDEGVLTRFPVLTDKSFVITQHKKNEGQLKCYLTQDYKSFELVDSFNVNSKVTLTKITHVYNTNAEIVGAFASLNISSKETPQTLNILLNPEDEIKHWIHSVGSNKLSSLQPEVCWYEQSDLMVLSTNAEKTFKSYYQLHKFSNANNPELLYPLTEEEKRSEKFKYVTAFKTDAAVTGAPPIADTKIPMKFFVVNNTLYIITQGFRRDSNTGAEQYLDLSAYKISGNKFIGQESFTGYASAKPATIDVLFDADNKKYLMIDYPKKVELVFDESSIEVSPLETKTLSLSQNIYGDYINQNSLGLMLLTNQVAGSKYSILFYPAK